MNKPLHQLTASETLSALAKKQISASELVAHYIARIESLDEKINAVVVRDFEQARQAAKMADQAMMRQQYLPLLGLPVTVKESFNVAQLPTTWGEPLYQDWRPEEDALAITRLKKAGAIILGKTNVPFMLQDWQTYNAIYGTTNNPWSLTCTPGGSSGGSAAALAAGFTALELGSDFAGSIRVPAAFCGVFGHKASVDLIPLRGATPPKTPPTSHSLSDMIVAGPMARSAGDLALGLSVLAGPDEQWNGKGYTLTLPAVRHKRLPDFRVLVIQNHPLCPTADCVHHAMDDLIERLREVGVQVCCDTQAVPDLAKITQTYITLFAGFVGANLPIEFYEQLAQQSAQDDVSISADVLRGCTVSYRDWLLAMRARNQQRQAWRALYQQFDVVICPVTPTTAFVHDHADPLHRTISIDGKIFPYDIQYAWPSIASSFGLPATVAPIAITDAGLPVGVQIIGDYLEDHTTIQFAHLLECAFGSCAFSAMVMK